MFTVRTIRAEDARVDSAAFDLEPELPQGRAVCNLFAEFLAGRPGEFREKLPFVAKGDVELEWAAAAGGAAFAAFFADAKPVSMGVLLSGVDQEADDNMLEALRVSVLEPIFGERAGATLDAPERPLLLTLVMNDQPEMAPAIQLLSTALASVYFRAVNTLRAAQA
jgi:hypothetical protein